VRGHHYAHGLHSPYWWLKCLVGTTNDQNWFVQTYHRLLVWDIMKRPRATRVLESMLAPVMGKSIVVYLEKP
jgi:Ni,Fe-hydrogenase I cytochrome b subunit